MGILAGLAGIFRGLNADAELKKRVGEAAAGGDTDHKLALARECRAHGMHAEAMRLYESCLQGTHTQDSTILFRLARAAVDASRWETAQAAIDRLKSEAPKTRPLEVRLLEARVLEGHGRSGEALALYHELLPQFVGLEARYRYGELLLSLGKREAAMEAFEELLKRASRFASSIEEEERWAAAAKQAVKAA